MGTTTVRALETVARSGELSGRTTLFITPGFEFRRVDALLTNFHLPRSTLLALVMAFAGVEVVRELYREAIARAVPLLLVRRRDAGAVTCGRPAAVDDPALFRGARVSHACEVSGIRS